MVEVEISPDLVLENEADEMADAGKCLTEDDLRNAEAEQLQAWGLSEKDRDAMLSGEGVVIGGMCICLECQDRLAEEQS